MDNIAIRTDTVRVDPVTGRYTENRSTRQINRQSPAYIAASINRLEVIADRPLKDRESICQALLEYSYCLPAEQLQALEHYCNQLVGLG